MACYHNIGIVGEWHRHKPSSRDMKALEDVLCLGDILEFDWLAKDGVMLGGGCFKRWGIYVGRYQDMQHAVILFDYARVIRGSSVFIKFMIRADTIGEILGIDRVRINNSRDNEEEPLDPEIIVRVAKIKHQSTISKTLIVDNMLNNNVERFVNLCRYDRTWSHQVFSKYSLGIEGNWCTSENITSLEEEVYLGDMLEFSRGAQRRVGCAQWGVYVGQYQGMQHAVIHIGMDEGSGGSASGNAFTDIKKYEIRADTIGKILDGSGRVRINNSTDKQAQPVDPDVIIKVAKIMHRRKTPIGFNILKNHCKHFVNLCRYHGRWMDTFFKVYNFGIKGNWYTSRNITDLEVEVCFGDRLEFFRGTLPVGYAHWGIYVGRYRGLQHAVIHFGMVEGGAAFFKKKISGSASSADQKPEVRADTIGKILGGSCWVRINNSRDKIVKPLNPQYIIDRAIQREGRTWSYMGYNCFVSNCEHFVNSCRYSQPHSLQVERAALAGCLAIAILGDTQHFPPIITIQMLNLVIGMTRPVMDEN